MVRIARAVPSRASATSLASTASTLGHVLVAQLEGDAVVLLEHGQDLQAAAAAAAAAGSRLVGDVLELAEHEARHDQRPDRKPEATTSMMRPSMMALVST